MAKGYLVLMLHAHLPFVRHPEYPSFLEENWLFEAISETYLPLLRVFDRLEADAVPFSICMSLSPTLLAMLQDDLLRQRYVTYLERHIELAEREVDRVHHDPSFEPLAQMYRDLYRQDLIDFDEKYGRDVLKGFDYYYKKGRIELVGAAATHPYLPLYQQFPVTVNAQLQVGTESQHAYFGKFPSGFWLPECGYFPGLESHLKNNGIRYFFAAAHSILFADRRPPAGVYEPVLTPNGTVVFGRDIASANMVWSPEDGYPGDFSYRDFYRDIGYDLPVDYIGPYIHDGNIRINTGFKYYAITGKSEQKQPYVPKVAAGKAVEHAENFIYNQLKQINRLTPLMKQPPVITCPYDAELFGHWWFEGPAWLEAVIRKLAETNGELELTTPTAFLKTFPPTTTIQPIYSSWGNNGYSEVWLDGSNDWIYRHTHTAIERMMELAQRFPDDHGLKERALNQAAREVLLSQASDWPFIMHAGTTVGYANRRVREHIMNFDRIYEALGRGNIGTEWLTQLEKRDNLFPNMNYRVFRADPNLVPKLPAQLARH